MGWLWHCFCFRRLYFEQSGWYRSSFAEIGMQRDGQLKGEGKLAKSMIVRSVAYEADIIRLTIGYEEYEESAVAEMMTVLADNGINLDMVIHVIHDQNSTISFSIGKEEFAKALYILETGKMSLGFSFADFEVGLAKVSIEGAGMDSTPEVTARLFSRLSKEGIQMKMISTSELKMSVIVAQDEMVRAANALHSEFQTT